MKLKSMVSIIALSAMVALNIPALSMAEEYSVTFSGKSAASVSCTYDGEALRNATAQKCVTWQGDSSINSTAMRFVSNADSDYTKFSSDGIKVGYKFNVEQSGIYSLDMSASDVSHMYLSGYSVSVDGGEHKTISTSASTVSANGDSALIKDYETDLKYSLSAGEHTFEVKINELPAIGTKTRFEIYVNTVTFKKTNDKYVPNLYVFGRDDYVDKTDGLSVLVSNDTASNIQTGSCAQLRTPSNEFLEGGYYITYPFTVPEDGMYKISDLGASINSEDINWLSKFAVAIDDGDFTRVVDMKASESEYSPASTFLKHMVLNKRYALTAGEHQLKLYLYNKREQGNAYVFFDYIKLSRDENNVVYGTDDFSANISHLTGSYGNAITYLKRNESYNPIDDGKNVSIKTEKTDEEFPMDGIGLDYSFYCDKAGWYSMNLLMGKNNGYFSPVEISVDGSYPYKFSSSDVGHIVEATDYDTNRKSYKTDAVVFLDKGMHSLLYKITGVATSRGYVLSFFTTAEFLEYDVSDKSSEIIISGSDGYASASDGLVVNTNVNEMGSVPVTKLTGSHEDFLKLGYFDITYPFNVYKEGKYNLSISANALDSIYVSRYAVGIDAETPAEIVSSIESTTDHPGGATLMKCYKTSINKELSAGVHSVTFRISRERWNAAEEAFTKGGYAFLDNIKLTLDEKPAYSLEVADEYVEEGGATLVSLTAKNPTTGEIITPAYKSVVFSSSDESIARVNSASGAVAAVFSGKATINAQVTENDGSVSVTSADVKVTKNYLYSELVGVYGGDVPFEELTGGTYNLMAKVNIYNNDLFDGKATVAFALYNGNKLIGVDILSKSDIIGFDTTLFTVKLDNVSVDSDTTYGVMVFNDLDALKPIVKKFK